MILLIIRVVCMSFTVKFINKTYTRSTRKDILFLVHRMMEKKLQTDSQVHLSDTAGSSKCTGHNVLCLILVMIKKLFISDFLNQTDAPECPSHEKNPLKAL